MSAPLRLAICVAVFLALLAFGVSQVNDHRAMVETEQRLLLNRIVTDQALVIERRLSAALLAASFLAFEVERSGGEIDDFEQYASIIMQNLGGITNLQMAPDGIITRIYPLAGHEPALGLDIINHPERRDVALRAIDRRGLSLAGPFELAQGGLGMIGRHPVFLDRGATEVFWGFASVLITLDDLLATIQIDQLESSGYAYELINKNPWTAEEAIFANSVMPLVEPAYRATIKVADREWELAISRSGEVTSAFEVGGQVIAALLSLLIAAGLYLILRQNEVLKRARDRADAANRERAEFLASMSHEIRTPLTGLLGVIHLLKRTGLDRDQQRYIETASTTGNMLLTVINDLLDIARLDDNDFPLERTSFEIGELIEDVTSVVAKAAMGRGVDVVCDIDAALPYRINGDPQRLRQVLNNLQSSVLARLRGGEIRVYATPLDGAIEIGIERPAIDPDDDPTLPPDGPSAGAPDLEQGMMISRRWIEAMGSRLEVSKEPNGKTRYSFRLAVDPADAEPYAWNPPASMRTFSICILSPSAARRDSLASAMRYWQIEHVDELEFDPDHDAPPADAEPCDVVLVDQTGSNEGVTRFIESRRNSADWRNTRFIQLLPQGASSDGSIADLCLYKPVGQSKLYSALMEMLYRISLESEFAETAGEAATAPQKPLQGRRLLLAEDNDINKVVALEILEETGAVIDVAVNGEEALEMAQQHDYDLILMDIQMPVMDGYEACRKIRALGGRHGEIPIIAMTAHARDSDRGKSLDAGMDHHIAKPFDPDVLIQVVIDHARGKGGPIDSG